jgi:hypothetical protein
MSREDAMRVARRAFGNVSRVEEESREVWRPRLMESTIGDVRHAFRLVRRHPAFSTNVIAISMLGVATCAATFSLVSGVLFAPLPFRDADRVFDLLLRSNDRGDITSALPLEVWDRVEAGSPVIEAISASQPSSVTVHWTASRSACGRGVSRRRSTVSSASSHCWGADSQPTKPTARRP